MLLLDEPTSALDLRYQVETLDLLAQHTVARRMCTVVAIHDLNLAAQFCDEVAMLHKGRILAHGPPGVVYREDLLSDVYGLAVRCTLVEGVPEVRPVVPSRSR